MQQTDFHNKGKIENNLQLTRFDFVRFLSILAEIPYDSRIQSRQCLILLRQPSLASLAYSEEDSLNHDVGGIIAQTCYNSNFIFGVKLSRSEGVLS